MTAVHPARFRAALGAPPNSADHILKIGNSMVGKRNKTVFIGCGTGRCGTTSLARLIGGCENAVCTHERRPLLPWTFNEELFQERVRWFSNSTASVIGDVAYYYLPYLERFIQEFPDVKIICLERDRQAVIDSYMWKTQWRNRWSNHNGTDWAKDQVWDATYPKYDTTDKAKAIGLYWDHYRKWIRLLAKEFPANLRTFGMDVLNTKTGQQKILDFLGIPERYRRYREKLRYNTRESTGRPWTKEEGFRWMQWISLTAQDITSVIPPESTIILVDQEQIRDYLPAQYHVIPFLEREGQYWGPPPDDATAIRELERLRRAGARSIVFAWPAFWWLDYYTGLRQYLGSHFRCLVENSRLVLFDLDRKGRTI